VSLTLLYSQIKHVNDIVLNIQKKYYGGVILLLALIPIMSCAQRAAGDGVAGCVASAISASNNARVQAELERHNREVEAQ